MTSAGKEATGEALRAAQTMLLRGAIAVAAGLVIAGTASQVFGGVLTLGGWLALVYGIHRYGRAREGAA
jgi:hypothetical protein